MDLHENPLYNTIRYPNLSTTSIAFEACDHDQLHEQQSPIQNEAEPLVQERETKVANNDDDMDLHENPLYDTMQSPIQNEAEPLVVTTLDDLDVQQFVEGEGSETEDGNVNYFEETRIYKKEFEAWVKGKHIKKSTALKYERTLNQMTMVEDAKEYLEQIKKQQSKTTYNNKYWTVKYYNEFSTMKNRKTILERNIIKNRRNVTTRRNTHLNTI